MEKRRKLYGVILLMAVMVAFLVSFSVSAYFFMNSGNLVFSENEDELKRLTILLSEKESRIADLEYELLRYKAMYEEELRKSPPMEINK